MQNKKTKVVTKWLVWSMFSKCFILTLLHNHFINKNRSFELSLKSQQARPPFTTQGPTKTRMSTETALVLVWKGLYSKGTIYITSNRIVYIHGKASIGITSNAKNKIKKRKKNLQIYQTARWKKCTVGTRWASSIRHKLAFFMILRHTD